MMFSVDYEHCTGCGACVQTCPKNCISWEERDLGFRFPVIDKDKCIHCGMCSKVCPIGKEIESSQQQKVYAVVHKDKNVLKQSTSGGMFTALADYVLDKGGIVYGCSLEKNMTVKHIRVQNKIELDKLRGSKYVQSDTMNTFVEAKQDLQAGNIVLYSGTPCQIAGLKCYLKKEYQNLITVDVVCHGVGSQSYFDKFMDDLQEREGEIIDLRFRSKEYMGWSCNGKIVISLPEYAKKKKTKPFYNHNNYYYYYFLDGNIYREACYSCPYANLVRNGDFTLGDFWGVEGLGIPIDINNGCSLVITNNEKAMQIISHIGVINMFEVETESAVRYNAQLLYPSLRKDSRKNRLGEYETMTGAEIQKIYLKNNKKVLLEGWIKKNIPYNVKLKIRKKLFKNRGISKLQ